MTRTMYDSVTPGHIPASATLVAGYADGNWPNLPAMRKRFPHATVVSIAISHNTRAQVLDVESGDASPAGAVQWCTHTMADTPNTHLTVYCNKSVWPSVRAAFRDAGVSEPQYWVASWTGEAELLPGTVATQYRGDVHPGYDLSVVADHWGGVDTGNPAPAPHHTAPAHSSPASYTVRSGDTLSGIAAAHHMSLSALERANPQITNPNLIHPGDVVHLTAQASHGGTYTVRSGDTLSGIAAAHHMSLSTLERLNPQITNPNLIHPGDTVHLG